MKRKSPKPLAAETIHEAPSAKAAALGMLSMWVAAIADRVRNPVAGIAAALEILEREISSGGEPERHELIDESLRRIRARLALLDGYVGELIHFARPPAAFPEPLVVTTLFTQVKEAALAALTDLDVATRVAPDAVRVCADSTRLVAVLNALVGNAVEAAFAAGHPKIELAAARALDRDRPGISLSIADNGPGFSPVALTKLYQPFYSTKEAGTGLGLAIALQFAKAHGGDLHVARSPVLGGALVSLFLPDKG